jgi:hypothetical protein
MIRGTTPKLIFTFPFEKEEIKALSLVICQGGMIRLEKTLEDVEIENYLLSFKLTQKETLSFWVDCEITMQIRVLTNSEEAFASRIISTDVERILKDGTI